MLPVRGGRFYIGPLASSLESIMARILITSALPYINGIKHLGNLAGSMLPADVHARFQRARGHEVLYICATDEHGTPAELAAAAAGQDVRTYCDEQHEIQKRAGDGLRPVLGLVRPLVQSAEPPPDPALLRDVLERHGLIEERVDRMIYSLDDRRFLPDRYVEGTCPHCGYEKARGDQCDNCGRLLDPTDLISPYSAVSGSRNLEIRDTRHLYLLQTKLERRLRDWLATKAEFPHLARSIALKHLDEGLIDRGITRDLSWGIPVIKDGFPRPGFEDKVFYVWFDAPIEYIAATVEFAEATGQDWRRWWRLDEGADDVRYVQVMGKDNVAFHTVSFPATILGSEEPWKMVDVLKAFNWLNWYGGKFSTSQKRGVFMDTALEILPADYWRWHLTANAPESSDAEFTWEHFQATVNKDLADVLGNFVNRILKFCEARFEGRVPEGGEPGPIEQKLSGDLNQAIAEAVEAFEALEHRKAAQVVRRIWVLGNEYLQEAAPWTAIKTDADRAAVIVRTGLNLCGLFAAVSQPIVPFAAKEIADALGLDGVPAWPGAEAAPDLYRLELDRLERGAPIRVPPVLFKKIEDAQVAEWTERFGGEAG